MEDGIDIRPLLQSEFVAGIADAKQMTVLAQKVQGSRQELTNLGCDRERRTSRADEARQSSHAGAPDDEWILRGRVAHEMQADRGEAEQAVYRTRENRSHALTEAPQ
jgi:hypothetical protein